MRKKRIYICLIIVLFFMVIGYSALNTNIFATGDIILTNNLDDFKVYIKNIFIDGNDYSNNIESGESFTVSNINELKKIKYSIMNESYEYDTKVEMKCSSITSNEEITFDIGTIEAQMSKEDEIQLDAGKCSYENGYTWDFDYNGTDGTDGSSQEFIVPCTGTYKLETWGANGGDVETFNYIGGYGSYSTGTIFLNESEMIFTTIGGRGTNCEDISCSAGGGYNGGGSTIANNIDHIKGSGGGATSIQNVLINDGQLFNYYNNQSNVLIVSGGGGGAMYHTTNPPARGNGGGGGGYIGNSSNGSYLTTGGTQSSGGISSHEENGEFGKGRGESNHGAGGGGFYGGGSGYSGGGGGSGYIGNTSLQNKAMYCYNCEESDKESTKTTSTECVSKTPTPNCAKQGNGYARITFMEKNKKSYTCTMEVTEIERNIKSKEYCSKLIGKTWDFDYNGTDGSDGTGQTFFSPCSGMYKVEVWGAQGGTSDDIQLATGGYGGYSTGDIVLSKSAQIYFFVGGKGANGDNTEKTKKGGYNGGGSKINPDSAYYSSSGGGASHVSTIPSILSELYNNKESVIIVAGGGGGGAGIAEGFNSEPNYGKGGDGGGITGNSGTNYLKNIGYGTGGTQTVGGCKSTGILCGSFGKASSEYHGEGNHGGTGGGGWYGGGATNFDNIGGGGGGSGYIGNESLQNKSMYCYDCEESKEVSTKTISTTGEDADKTNCPNGYSSSPISNCAKQGHGYARITLLNLN